MGAIRRPVISCCQPRAGTATESPRSAAGVGTRNSSTGGHFVRCPGSVPSAAARSTSPHRMPVISAHPWPVMIISCTASQYIADRAIRPRGRSPQAPGATAPAPGGVRDDIVAAVTARPGVHPADRAGACGGAPKAGSPRALRVSNREEEGSAERWLCWFQPRTSIYSNQKHLFYTREPCELYGHHLHHQQKQPALLRLCFPFALAVAQLFPKAQERPRLFV